MSAFSRDEEEKCGLDWTILRDGGIALYRQSSYLAEDVRWFREHQFLIHSFDCKSWISEREMHDDLSRKLSFPDYYGMNWNALNDCLREDLIVRDDGGTVLLFDGFDAYAKGAGAGLMSSGRSEAETLLDIVARASRQFSLTGRRLIVLIRSDDPRMY